MNIASSQTNSSEILPALKPTPYKYCQLQHKLLRNISSSQTNSSGILTAPRLTPQEYF